MVGWSPAECAQVYRAYLTAHLGGRAAAADQEPHTFGAQRLKHLVFVVVEVGVVRLTRSKWMRALVPLSRKAAYFRMRLLIDCACLREPVLKSGLQAACHARHAGVARVSQSSPAPWQHRKISRLCF